MSTESKTKNRLNYLKFLVLVVGFIIILATNSTAVRFFVFGIIVFVLTRRATISVPIAQSSPQPSRPTINTSPINSVDIPESWLGAPIAYKYHNSGIAMANTIIQDFQTIHPGDHIVFVPEPTNEYDAKAIKIMAGSQLLGYVYRGKMQDMLHDFMIQGSPIYGVISSVLPEEKKVKYNIGFYRDFMSVFIEEPLATGRLSASSGEEAQDNILLCEENDEVFVDYNYEKERYEVSVMGYIGNLPKKLEAYAETATFKIDEIGMTDSDKYYVVVAAYE